MILEAANFLATYAISRRRHPAEINASVKLWARGRRCARHWKEHEKNCEAFIRQHMPESRRVAVVLGSGALRDVAVRELSNLFREVRLYDLEHLASVQLWARMQGLKNLAFIQRDLSDGLGFLADDGEIDLVISANLLSQLGLASRSGRQEPATVMGRHVEGLAALPGRRLLISDVEYAIVSRDGRFVENFNLVPGVALPPEQAGWHWTVAPFGEIDRGYKAVHRVAASAL